MRGGHRRYQRRVFFFVGFPAIYKQMHVNVLLQE